MGISSSIQYCVICNRAVFCIVCRFHFPLVFIIYSTLTYLFKFFNTYFFIEGIFMHRELVRPGYLEVYYGAMKSGKTKALLDRLEQISFLKGLGVLAVKPKVDSRDNMIKSRNSKFEIETILIDENNPWKILDLVSDDIHVVAIDEAQFFSKDVVKVIEDLLLRDINVLVAGLNTDFRGEPFGPMGEILALSNKSYSLAGVCDFEGCNKPGTRTQRLINGEPAHFDSPIVLIEGSGIEEYQTRCLKHHVVPGKKLRSSNK